MTIFDKSPSSDEIRETFDNNWRKMHGLPLKHRARYAHQTKNKLNGNHKKIIKLGASYWMPIDYGWRFLSKNQIFWFRK